MEKFELKSVDRVVLAAREECLEHGRRTGEEMGILIRDGEIWIRQMGGADSVNFASFSQEIMRVRDDGAKLVLAHNHPYPVMPLSAEDWNFASGLGRNGEVWAVGEDGGMFRGKGKGDGWK